MEIRVLKYFLTVAREGSITRAAEILHVTQPTLSHHMKILVECGLVNARKEGKWQHYSLNCETLTQFKEFIEGLTCCGCGRSDFVAAFFWWANLD